MRTITLILLVALTALAKSRQGSSISRDKRELLVRSKRRWVLSTIEVDEEDKGPFPRNISRMFNDKKHAEGEKYRIKGMGVTQHPLGVFQIDENTGVVSALQSIDRETYEFFEIKFEILSRLTGAEVDKELGFNIEIKDINDNEPKFEPPVMQANVKENKEEGQLLQLVAHDRDQLNTSNSKITMRKKSQHPQEPEIYLEQITNRLGELKFKGCFDYDKAKTYEIIVEATDHGDPPLSSTGVVTLNIIDTNSHPPMFKKKNYKGEVFELITKEDVLRIAVDDKDAPKTPGWRADYFFIKGNEDENYKIETDPDTNEGILSVIKGKDFEKAKEVHLQVGVKNMEALLVCRNKLTEGPPPDIVNITMTVINVNDPPRFLSGNVTVYQKEEEAPGKVLFIPKVEDEDSEVSKIRYVLLNDPAGWATIDKETGKITQTKKMDRESPFVDKKGIYRIVTGAVDDGKPPATGTCTVLVHLGDINDNSPKLVNGSIIMCGNKNNKVMVPAIDTDDHPFSGPFTFSLGGADATLKKRWKLDPAFGEESGLISLKTLPYGNYSVPLEIQDQQGSTGSETVVVVVCDCGTGDACRKREPASSKFGAAAIGLLCLGLLSFLLLLLLFMCQCGGKELQHMPTVEDEGNQTLIKYNQEGGGSACTAEPTLLLTPTHSIAVTDGIKKSTIQMSQTAPVMVKDREMYGSSTLAMMNHSVPTMGMQHTRDITRSRGQSMYSTWGTDRMNSYQGGSSRYNRSVSLRQTNLTDRIDRRLYMIDGNHMDHPVYLPYKYAYEGQGSQCQSLDQLSLNNLGDDLTFLNDLGPKFKTLGRICHHTTKDKNIQL